MTNSINKRAVESQPSQGSFQEMMKAVQQGDKEIYKVLLESLSPVIKLYVRRFLSRMGKWRLGVDEDLLQEILLAIHQKRHTYDPNQLFMPWVFAIARYKTIDFARQEKRRGISIPMDEIAQTVSHSIFSEPGATADLMVLLAQLPRKSRQIVELVKLEGLSIAEAAATAQMSESAVKVSIHRALQKLRSLNKKDGVHEDK